MKYGGLTLPILEYDHTAGCSVTGGYRYRGSANPDLEGIYLFYWHPTRTGSFWDAVVIRCNFDPCLIFRPDTPLGGITKKGARKRAPFSCMSV